MGENEITDLQDKARRMREEGYTRDQIAETLGITQFKLTTLLDGCADPRSGLRARAKDDLRARARELRRAGYSYREIVEELGVAKSTVSVWVRDIEVTLRPEVAERMARMTAARWAGHRERVDRQRAADKRAAQDSVGSLSDRELLLLGVVAYWCEGAKDKPWDRREDIRFVNSDPRLIVLFLAWLALLGVGHERLRLRVLIHETADAEAARRYWSDVTGVPLERFGNSTIKRSKPVTIRKNTGDGYHGCLVVHVLRSATLYRAVEGWFAGIAQALTDEPNVRYRSPVV